MRDVQAQHGAADRLPEADVDLVFQVGARLGLFLDGCATAPTAEHAGKNVAEPAAAPLLLLLRAAGFEQVGKIEAAEIDRNFLAAAALAGESAGKTAAAAARIRLGRRGIDVVRGSDWLRQ